MSKRFGFFISVMVIASLTACQPKDVSYDDTHIFGQHYEVIKSVNTYTTEYSLNCSDDYERNVVINTVNKHDDNEKIMSVKRITSNGFGFNNAEIIYDQDFNAYYNQDDTIVKFNLNYEYLSYLDLDYFRPLSTEEGFNFQISEGYRITNYSSNISENYFIPLFMMIPRDRNIDINIIEKPYDDTYFVSEMVISFHDAQFLDSKLIYDSCLLTINNYDLDSTDDVQIPDEDVYDSHVFFNLALSSQEIFPELLSGFFELDSESISSFNQGVMTKDFDGDIDYFLINLVFEQEYRIGVVFDTKVTCYNLLGEIVFEFQSEPSDAFIGGETFYETVEAGFMIIMVEYGDSIEINDSAQVDFRPTVEYDKDNLIYLVEGRDRTTMYQEFEDPGYVLHPSIVGEEVQIYTNLDIYTPGEYYITYSVNINGEIYSVTRTVEVRYGDVEIEAETYLLDVEVEKIVETVTDQGIKLIFDINENSDVNPDYYVYCYDNNGELVDYRNYYLDSNSVGFGNLTANTLYQMKLLAKYYEDNFTYYEVILEWEAETVDTHIHEGDMWFMITNEKHLASNVYIEEYSSVISPYSEFYRFDLYKDGILVDQIEVEYEGFNVDYYYQDLTESYEYEFFLYHIYSEDSNEHIDLILSSIGKVIIED